MVNTVATTMAARDAVLARYEEMRQEAIQGSGAPAIGHGVAVLLRHGMAAWMGAWSECCPRSTEMPGGRQVEQDVMPRALAPEVVVVLAEMVFQANKEEQ